MGSLSIQVSTDNGVTWSNDLDFMASGAVSGNMGSDWRQGFLDLTAYKTVPTLTIRFKGTTGSGYASDICLDDISIVCAASSPITVSESINL